MTKFTQKPDDFLGTELEPQPDFVKSAVHFMIKEVAQGLAAEFWDQMVTSRKRMGPDAARAANAFYKTWPRQRQFVHQKWTEFIITARQTLVLLLGKPGFDEKAKQDIHAALLLDGTINPRKLSPQAAQAAYLEDQKAKRQRA